MAPRQAVLWFSPVAPSFMALGSCDGSTPWCIEPHLAGYPRPSVHPGGGVAVTALREMEEHAQASRSQSGNQLQQWESNSASRGAWEEGRHELPFDLGIRGQFRDIQQT